MADKNISALKMAPSIADDSLFVMEQQGDAMKVSGLLVKNYAKQGVEMNVKDDVDKANAAADRAETASKQVVDMTVTAHASDKATVTKGIKEGVVNLDFGLPRGERGEQGVEGPVGPRGAKGDPGNGLTILGHYDTEELLRASIMDPKIGDAYGIGLETPYDIYIYGSDNGGTPDWKNYGPLTGGGGGGPLHDNVVTTDGGGELEFSGGLGYPPYIVEFTPEEDEPLNASDIVYDEGTVQDALENLFTSVADGKETIASAISDKGVQTEKDASWQEMADNIEQIQTGGDTSDATATEFEIVGPYTAYTAKGKVTGVIPSLPAHTYTPGTQPQTISAGNYIAGTQTIEGDTNLTPVNIRHGVTIFGVEGSMESQFQATLTVTVDIGAIATATHSGGTELEALCTTGQVVFELPLEGQWTITARRGVAQYNSVVIEVSSRYSASLTAEIHVEYYMTATTLNPGRYNLAATSNKNYAIFAGGYYTSLNGIIGTSTAADAYDKNLTKPSCPSLNYGRQNLAATSIGEYALFGGGKADGGSPTNWDTLDAYDGALTKIVSELSASRYHLAAASIGNYALFGGGRNTNDSFSQAVDVYDQELTMQTPLILIQARNRLAAASNENYAVFAGGLSNIVDAFNSDLTRTAPETLSVNHTDFAGVTAGNYVVFAGGSSDSPGTVDAYDLFLTHTTPDALHSPLSPAYGTSLKGFGVINGYVSASSQTPVLTDVYDPYLTHTTVDAGRRNITNSAATSIGDYALFGGGQGLGGGSTVYVYRYQ